MPRRRPAWLLSLTQQGSKPPMFLKFRSSDGLIIGTISLAVFTDMFLYGVIVPVIPFALEERSHVTHDRVQYWVSVLIAIYGAALLAFSPICGWLADHSSSRRTPLLLGLVALLGATVMLHIGSKIGILIVARILQGVSAAVVWVVGLALLADTVPQNRLAQSMGYLSLGMSLGILIAPLLGGVVYEKGGYGAVFAMAYALVGLDIILRLLLVEKKVAARWDPEAEERVREINDSRTGIQKQPKETNGAATVVTDPEKGTSETTTPAPSDPITTEPLPERTRDRLPPVISLLYSRRLLSALFCSLIQAALMTSFDSVLTLRAAEIFHWRSTGAALLFLPIVIPTFIAPLFGYMSDRWGGRYLATFGFVLACAPFVCLRFVEENTIRDKVLICTLLALIGFSLAMTFPPFMAEISGIVEAKERKMLAMGGKGYGKGGAYAQAYALFNVAFAGGCMIGPLLAGFVADKSWSTMAWVLGLLDGVTAIPAFLFLGGWFFEKA
ncbi:MFS general substrate transporter [Amniculicola lignicola CBS 123094]|uniref:MFS general substrate transporter n=1 Tax=Amniculicola lignicola CBS 123094 TaxID=1392246 RepID=A0A6A5WBX8_9PLEO|nr:MFS general substrate transporter [Amniculicola lignicola CBS 123094]